MKFLVFFFPIILFLIVLSIKLVSPDTYTTLIQEDSPIEYAQALFYFLASVVSFFVSAMLLKNKMMLHGILFVLLALGLLFTSLEEISWGQRVFDVVNPEYFEQYNVQNEISFHNLQTTQPLLHSAYILTGAYGAFSWLFVLVFLPKVKENRLHLVNYIVPDWYLSSYFFFVFFIYIMLEYARSYTGGLLVGRDQEPVELILSLGFFFFLITKRLQLREYLIKQTSDDTLNKSID